MRLGDSLQHLSHLHPPHHPVPPQRRGGIAEGLEAAINSGRGTLLLTRCGLDSQAHKVDQTVDYLGRHTRPISTRRLAAEIGMPVTSTATLRRVLATLGCPGAGRSWAPDTSPGSMSKVPVWSGRRHWVELVVIMVGTSRGKAALRRRQVSARNVITVARQDASVADGRTGREVRTSHATVAAHTALSCDVVRRARYVLADLRLSVTIVRGRYMSTAERLTARAHHGGWQRRFASTRALTVPRDLIPVHLPRRGSDSTTSHVSSYSPKRAGARRNDRPRPLALQRLAARLISRLPHLGSRHVGTICQALTIAGVDPQRWTAAQLLHLIDLRGLTQPDTPRNPVGLFIHQLRQAVRSSEQTLTGFDVLGRNEPPVQAACGGDHIGIPAVGSAFPPHQEPLDRGVGLSDQNEPGGWLRRGRGDALTQRSELRSDPTRHAEQPRCGV